MLAPSGAKARYEANVAAVRLAKTLADEERAATAAEQAVLARYGSWGAVADVFDPRKENWAAERAELRDLLTEREYDAARRTTINAHFTDPALVREIWSGLSRLGFNGGRVLEPGAGAGTFIGLAPDNAEMLGIELDPITAQIARSLYPDADVRTESFADTKLPLEYVDAVVGNVPFGDVQLHDPVHNPGRRHSIHNHFILKSLAVTRPGGMVAVLSSAFTLDAQNPAARREMNKLADLAGAVRLPSGAHRRAAGTEVVTDLLVFRRRADHEPPRDRTWENVTAHDVDDQRIHFNSYFDTRPKHILGDVHAGQGMHGDATLHITNNLSQVPEQFRSAIDGVVIDAAEHDLAMTPRPSGAPVVRELDAADQGLWDGTIIRDGDGFATVDAGTRNPLKVAAKNTRELGQLIDLRDQVTALLDLEASTLDDTEEITTARADLRVGYESYAARYGPINRYTHATNGNRITPEAPRKIMQDPFGPPVLALERFDDDTQHATPAAILTGRVVVPRPVRDTADTPAEAVTLSMERHGAVRLDTIAQLLDTDEQDARSLLGELVYDDPAQEGRVVPAAEYLSGNIAERLDAARAASETDPDRYTLNITALETVLPEPMGTDEIEARIGSVWIDADAHEQFFQQLLRNPNLTVTNPLPGEWAVTGGTRGGVLATETWGTEDKPAHELAKALLNQSPVRVEREIEDGDRTVRKLDQEATTAAAEKAEEIQERFSEWVWEDPERAERLQAEFNRRFNSIVLRSYDNAGDHLTLPGLVATFEPRPHQRAAVARILAEPAVGLFHQVGAGKTAEMVIGAMELKRMGLVSKPAVVVPNHMLKQFAREWLQLYPQARILAAGSADLQKDKRRLFVARAAANDWDAVILTQTAFQSLPVSEDATESYIGTEVAGQCESLDAAQEAGADGMSVKRIEKSLARAEERLKKEVDISRDAGMSFEQTGIDYLFVDEAHQYKNLFTPTSHQIGVDGSRKATDLHMKIGVLRERNGSRVATLATATPLANSITEAFTMQRYLRPDLLHAAGIRVFDQWAATFATTNTEVELSTTGKLKSVTRLSRFQNVPEMLRMWHVSADVKTQEDLNLPVPDLALRDDGERLPVTHAIAPSPALIDYFADLGERADNISGFQAEPGADNMLKISTDGRKAAVAAELVGIDPDPDMPSKADVAAATMYRIWEQNRSNEYVVPETGEPSPIRGGMQIVFSDYGTPNDDGRHSIYDDLKAKLVDRGMDPGTVRFIHDAGNDREKDRLFAAARAGHIAVLIGSTEKMGVGTNVQARAVAIHHLDCPWRPSDVEQRDGRIVRQGNQNAEIGAHRYVVERSYDAFMWQTVERKSKFITQVMKGSLDAREIDDVGDAKLNAAESKAIGTGNPLLLEQVQANDQLHKLRRLERAHNRSQSNLIRAREAATRRVGRAANDMSTLEDALPRIIDTSGDAFAIQISTDGGYGRSYTDPLTERADAAAAIAAWAQQARLPHRHTSAQLGMVAKIGDFTVRGELITAAGMTRDSDTIAFTLDGIPGAETRVPRGDVVHGSRGVVTRLENLQSSLPRVLGDVRERQREAQQIIADADAQVGAPFKYADDLTDAQTAADDIARRLTEQEQDEPTPAPSPTEIAREIASPEWWTGRKQSEVNELLERARRDGETNSAWKDVHTTLEAQLRKRLPAEVAQRVFGVPALPTTPRPARPDDTGPVVGASPTDNSGPSLR